MDYVELLEDEAEGVWEEAWKAGKHGEWGDVPRHFPGKGRDDTWVVAELPVALLNFDWEADGATKKQMARAEVYAREPGSFPPGVALLNERSVRRQQREGAKVVRAFVADGNHRGLATLLRGEARMLMMMPRSDFHRLLGANE